MRKLVLLCTFAILMSYQVVALCEELDAENLIQPSPFPEGEWKLLRDIKRDELLTAIWMGQVGDVRGVIQTNVFRGTPLLSINQLRQVDEKSGREACAELISETLKEETQNNYLVLEWKITCKNSDGSIKMTALNKAIAGNDATYKLQKTWWPEASKESWDTWVQYFQKVHVCDSRLKDRKCPSGYRRVQ